MKTKLLKVGFTTALIVFICGGLLFGTIKMIDATQTKVPDCIEQTKPDCNKNGEERPICPNLNPIPRCPLNAAE